MKKDLIFVLYGSTGDLSFRKLLPAITNLKNNNLLPERTLILTIGRRDFNTKEYLDFVYENNNDLDLSILSDLVLYHQMQITEQADYVTLNNIINEYSLKTTRVIHYLSVAPEFMLDVANNISETGLVSKNELNKSLIFEKPFGHDFKTSNILNKNLWTLFEEEQIYRIDHYLGKSLINHLYELKFNSLTFNSIFNYKNIKEFTINAKEAVGILNRGAFYEATGAVKDMFQSHILQVVSLLLMDEPKNNSSKAIIDEKVKVLRNLKYNKKNIVFGQYNGYLEEKNVSENSLTETLLYVELTSAGKYKNIPVKVLTGKKMTDKETNIKITLKDNSEITIGIFPKSTITIKTSISETPLVFENELNDNIDEYGKLIHAAILSNKEVYVRWDEIEESWKFVDQLLKEKKELVIYTNELKK